MKIKPAKILAGLKKALPYIAAGLLILGRGKAGRAVQTLDDATD